MTKFSPSIPVQLVEELDSDIDAIIREHHLDQKGLTHAKRTAGAQLIGHIVNQAFANNLISHPTPLLNEVGKRLNARYVKGFSGVKLMDFARLEAAFPAGTPIRAELTSGQIDELARIDDDQLRMALMDIAADEKWSEWDIRLHGQGLDDALESNSYGYSSFEADADALRYIRAYVAAYGIIDIHEAQLLYCGGPGPNRASFAFDDTVLFLDRNYGKSGEPYVWKPKDGTFLIAPELVPENVNIRYHIDDYRYSYQPYSRQNEYAEEERSLRMDRIKMRRDHILKKHREAPAKEIDFDRVVHGDTSLERLSYQLKQVLAREYNDSRHRFSFCEGEFDYALEKLLRYVGMTGAPAAEDFEYDLEFLCSCIGLNGELCRNRECARNVLERIYQIAPIWEQNGHSTKDLEPCQDSDKPHEEGKLIDTACVDGNAQTLPSAPNHKPQDKLP